MRENSSNLCESIFHLTNRKQTARTVFGVSVCGKWQTPAGCKNKAIWTPAGLPEFRTPSHQPPSGERGSGCMIGKMEPLEPGRRTEADSTAADRYCSLSSTPPRRPITSETTPTVVGGTSQVEESGRNRAVRLVVVK